MRCYLPKIFEFDLKNISAAFQEYMGHPESQWSAFIAHTNESEHRTLGHREHGVYHYDVWIKSPHFYSRLADYLRYEYSFGRKTAVFFPYQLNWENDIVPELIKYWSENEFRTTDPKYIVHSTTIECGESIVKDGTLKSFKRLITEGYFDNKRLGHSQLGEPEDFKEHINFAPYTSIWAEMVVSSNQKGRFVTPDEEYTPGYRFYFDAVKLANDKKFLRTGNGIPTCHDVLTIEPYLISYQTVNTFSGSVPERWTPRLFTEIANRRFEELLFSRGITE